MLKTIGCLWGGADRWENIPYYLITVGGETVRDLCVKMVNAEGKQSKSGFMKNTGGGFVFHLRRAVGKWRRCDLRDFWWNVPNQGARSRKAPRNGHWDQHPICREERWWEMKAERKQGASDRGVCGQWQRPGFVLHQKRNGMISLGFEEHLSCCVKIKL